MDLAVRFRRAASRQSSGRAVVESPDGHRRARPRPINPRLVWRKSVDDRGNRDGAHCLSHRHNLWTGLGIQRRQARRFHDADCRHLLWIARHADLHPVVTAVRQEHRRPLDRARFSNLGALRAHYSRASAAGQGIRLRRRRPGHGRAAAQDFTAPHSAQHSRSDPGHLDLQHPSGDLGGVHLEFYRSGNQRSV